MKKLKLATTIVLCTLVLSASEIFASDLDKEKRWAEQVVDQLFDGDAVWLTADGVEFLGIKMEAEGTSKGSAIILHGMGVHPDWPQVINPLRVGLAESGWNTLSIQLPVLLNDAAPEDYVPLYAEVPGRLTAAIEAVGEAPVFLVAHSMGASMALHFLDKVPGNDVAGLVAIGDSSGGAESLDPAAQRYRHVQIPILDLHGEFDLENVISGINVRSEAAKSANNDDFTQIEIAGADHFFEENEDELLDAVMNWLDGQR